MPGLWSGDPDPGGINAKPVPHEGLNIRSIPHDAIQHRANSSASQSFVWYTRFVAVTHPSTDYAQCCLTSVIEGMGALNIAYGRRLRARYLCYLTICQIMLVVIYY
jgi:hypothetical protein